MPKLTQYTFLGALKEHFGYTSNKELFEEVKKLTIEDRSELRIGLLRAGYNILDPKPTEPSPGGAIIALPEPKEEPIPAVSPGYSVGDEHPAAQAV